LAGEIETVSEIIAAPGYAKFRGQLIPKRWIFRLFGGERGMIKVPGSEKIMGYSSKRKKYWIAPPGELALFSDKNWDEADTEDEKTAEETSLSGETVDQDTNTSEDYKKNRFIEFANNVFTDDNAIPSISRSFNDTVETINGFRAKKWTTTISTKKNKMLIEEWVVNELPLRDSLYAYIASSVDDEFIENINKIKFSSLDFIGGVDSTYSLLQSDEKTVMAKLTIDSDAGWMESATFEIRELYIAPFNPITYTIPEDYERLDLDRK
tara:strand:+ start:1503 stop:2300 length:798 start_codon:yes stop_codon:yes gene_type:complete